jgi:hypothetical protein
MDCYLFNILRGNQGAGKNIDVALHCEDDFSVSGELATGLGGIKFKNGKLSAARENELELA